MGRNAVIFSSSEVLPVAESTGFKAEMIEKVLHLINLLDALKSHTFLRGKWVLKGGTALNMFKLDLPRPRYPFLIFMNWLQANLLLYWRGVRQEICSIVIEFLKWTRLNAIDFA